MCVLALVTVVVVILMMVVVMMVIAMVITRRAMCRPWTDTSPVACVVQDVYGDPGDPKFRFYSLPARCLRRQVREAV